MKIKIGRFQWKSRIEHRRLVLLMGVALVALVAGVSVFVGLVRLPAPVPRATDSTPETLNVVRVDADQRSRILGEEAILFDPTPLFLPTRFNSTQIDVATMTHREPGESFKPFPPQYAFSDEAFSISFPDPAKPPAQPVDALVYGRTGTPYALFGRFERPEAPLATRMAFLEVVHMKTGRTVFSKAIPPPAQQAGDGNAPKQAPPPEALSTMNWRPLEFLAAIDVAGLVGSPTLAGAGSGSPAIDQYWEHYLAGGLHLGAQSELSAGFYMLRIGP